MYHGHYKNSQQHNSDNNQKSVPILDFRGPYVKLCWPGGGGGGLRVNEMPSVFTLSQITLTESTWETNDTRCAFNLFFLIQIK